MWIKELTARIGLCRGLLRQIENDIELDPRDPAVVKLTHIIRRRLRDLEVLHAEACSTEGALVADKVTRAGSIDGLGEYFLLFRPASRKLVA